MSFMQFAVSTTLPDPSFKMAGRAINTTPTGPGPLFLKLSMSEQGIRSTPTEPSFLKMAGRGIRIAPKQPYPLEPSGQGMRIAPKQPSSLDPTGQGITKNYQRVIRFREKLSEDPARLAEHKTVRKEQNKIYYSMRMKSLSPEEVLRRREKDRLRQQRCRMKKKLLTMATAAMETGIATSQATGMETSLASIMGTRIATSLATSLETTRATNLASLTRIAPRGDQIKQDKNNSAVARHLESRDSFYGNEGFDTAVKKEDET